VRQALAVVLACLACALLVAGCGPSQAAAPESPLELRLVPVAGGLSSPVQVVATPSEPRRLYLVEQTGLVRVRERGRLLPKPFLDLRAATRAAGEQGLLTLAFHPRYKANRRLFVMYTDRSGDTCVVEYRARVGGRPPQRVRELLFVDQPYENHNGGTLAFGPDGRLWLGLGDGGDAFDPQARSQDLSTRLGKLLRADVDAKTLRWETVAYGLRNPWRMSFDRATGDLWIGDVGQDLWEEIDVLPRGASGLLDFGWDVYEGFERVEDKERTPGGTLVEPVAVYGREDGCSVTGGFVYRGAAIPGLRGRYVYGDYCSGTVWSLRLEGGKAADVRRERVEVPNLSSFGEGVNGELYLVGHDGRVFQLAPPRA
jgi:glucose/arabinose dehydrogenase